MSACHDGVWGSVSTARPRIDGKRHVARGVTEGKGTGKKKLAARKNEGGTAGASNDVSTTGESGECKRRRKVGQEHRYRDATRRGQGDGGRQARL